MVTPERAGWTYSGLKVLTLPPGGTRTWATGRGRDPGPAAVRVGHRDVRQHDLRAAGPAQRLLPGQRLLLRAARRHHHRDQPGRRRVRHPERPLHAPARTPVWSRRGCARGTARGRPGQPPGQQLLLARGVRLRQAHRGRGAHPRRELVLLPAAQARRDARGRGRTRGDLLLRDRGPRLPAGLRHARPPDRRAGRGEHGRRDPDPARLARAVDRRARLRPVLPQRDGGARADQVLAVLRRPGARMDPRHLGRPGDRPAPSPYFRQRRR